MTNHRKRYDALFVINQDSDLSHVSCLCKERGFDNTFLLTTHALFDDELHYIRNAFPALPKTASFADLLDDSDMEHCDDEAYRHLLSMNDGHDFRRDDYAERFIVASRFWKKRLVRDRLTESCEFGSVYHGTGLGIDSGACGPSL